MIVAMKAVSLCGGLIFNSVAGKINPKRIQPTAIVRAFPPLKPAILLVTVHVQGRTTSGYDTIRTIAS